MPFNTIEEAKKDKFPTVIKGIALTIGQVNTLSKMFDSIKNRSDVKEPMAAAISTFKKSHDVKEGKFVTKKDMSDDYINECIENNFSEKQLFQIKDKEIFAAGTWIDNRGNKTTFTEKDLDDIVDAFNNGVRQRDGIPLRFDDHNNKYDPALGWVESVKRVGKKILADFRDVTQLAKNVIEKKMYTRVSSGLIRNYIDPIIKNKFNLVLDHVALLGAKAPGVKGLSDVFKFFSDNNGEQSVYILELNEEGKIIDNFHNGESQQVIPGENNQYREESKMSEEVIKKLQNQINELSNKLNDSEKEKKYFSEKLENIEKEKKENEKKAKDEKINNFIEKMKNEGRISPAMEGMVKRDLERSENFEEAKKEVESYEVKFDFSEKGGAYKKENTDMEENYQEEKNRMESQLFLSSNEKIELSQFDMHKKIEKAVEDGKYKNYEEALIALSPYT